MNQKKIYFFRHGQTDWNKEGRLQGQTKNTELNQTGKEQAFLIAKKLESVKLDVIFSSPLLRAQETALIVSKHNKNIPVILLDDLKEINFGIFEGLLGSEIKESYKDFYKNFENIEASMDLCYPKGETRRECIARITKVFNEVIFNSDYENIAISTHGAILWNLFFVFFDERFEHIENAKVFTSSWCDNQFGILTTV